MNRPGAVSLVFVIVLTAGCSTFSPTPTTVAEDLSGYAYIPVDPAKIEIVGCKLSLADMVAINGKAATNKVLDLLPDNAVRMSMELFDAKGNASYGATRAGVESSSYRLTADYINSDTVNKTVWIKKVIRVEVTETGGGRTVPRTFFRETPRSLYQREDFLETSFKRTTDIDPKTKNPVEITETQRGVPGSGLYFVRSHQPTSVQCRKNEQGVERCFEQEDETYKQYNVPIYIGIGLRVVSEGRLLSAQANISGIGVVGAEAEARRIAGSLTVQAIGVNGQSVSSALPVQSELSRTTAENAFVAIGAIKAMLHQPDVVKLPRVVGLYLPMPGGRQLVNALVSELSREPVEWCPAGFGNAEKKAKAEEKVL
jgi:hypothetical protein